VISHSCVVDANQRLYADLARAHPELEVLLIAPEFWWNRLSGGQVFSALPETVGLAHPLPVRLSGQMHLHWYPRRRLGRLLETFRPQVLLLDEEPYSVAGLEGTSLGKALGARVLVYTKQNLFRRYPPPISWMQNWVLRHADGMLAVSPECEEVLRRRGYQGRVGVLPHGVDVAGFAPAPSAELRGQLGLRGPVIGFAGQLEERKGLPDLLEAARRLREQRGESFHLLIVGDGPLRGRAEEFTATQLGPGQARHLGFVAHGDMPDYIRAMDVLALPSRTTGNWKEQFGRVLLEALACGVPVVGSDSGYIPELIAQTGGGLVFPEGDVAALAERLAWVLDHPEQAREKGRQGREVVVREYSSARVAERLYGELMIDN
jgi:glycosyltransferase involved in cell wall biosynthesis